ncbi:hypothetical protein [Dyadobacter bucti]|uniref:hypothetical protein n=1 Tax=Dyadobacter bucti TaxID=2572203 RepID=UPI003F70211F
MTVILMVRRLIASLLLINYLWLAGIGCISRPEENPYVLKIEKSYGENHRYEACRYMRMDGLESLMQEVLASHFVNSPDEGGHLDITVTTAIDSHFAPDYLLLDTVSLFNSRNFSCNLKEIPLSEISFSIFSPPKQSVIV